jgi:hypothetical protein
MLIEYSDVSLTSGWTSTSLVINVPNSTSQVVNKDITSAAAGSHRYWRIRYNSGTTGQNAWLGEVSFQT